jgi:hypothetical protein
VVRHFIENCYNPYAKGLRRFSELRSGRRGRGFESRHPDSYTGPGLLSSFTGEAGAELCLEGVAKETGSMTPSIVEVFCEFGFGVVPGDVALVKDRPSANA